MIENGPAGRIIAGGTQTSRPMRLMGVIADTKEKIAELQGQIATDELRIEALDAYEHAKGGKAPGGKGSKRGLRRPKPTSSAGSSSEPIGG